MARHDCYLEYNCHESARCTSLSTFYECNSGKSCKMSLLLEDIEMPTFRKPAPLNTSRRKRRPVTESTQSYAMFSPPAQCDSAFVLGKHAKLMRPQQTERNQEKGALSRFRRYYHNGLFKTQPSETPSMSKAANNSLKAILEDSDSLTAFRQFLAKEFSDENLDFWRQCEKYKREKPSKRFKMANKIYETYVKDNAPREINISSRIKKEIKKNLQHLDDGTFDSAQSSIFRLMERDSLPRFISYKSMKSSSQNEDQSKLDRKASLQPSVSSSMLLGNSAANTQRPQLKRQSSL